MSEECSKRVQTMMGWLIIGPLLIMLSSLVTVHNYPGETLIFSGVAAVGIAAYPWWGEKTLQAALFAIFICFIGFLWKLPISIISSHSLYLFGLSSTFILSLGITLMSFRMAEDVFKQSETLPEVSPDKFLEFNQMLQQNLEDLQKSSEEKQLIFQQSLSQLQAEKEELHNQSQQLQQQFELVQRELTEKRGEAIEQQKYQQQLLQQLQTYKSQSDTIQQLTNERESFALVNSDQIHQIKCLEQELNQKKDEVNIFVEQMIALETEQSSLKHLVSEQQKTHELLESITKERDSLQAALEQKGSLSALERELHRIKGLYQQLKEQFEEKDRLLQETRQSLFIAQEQYEADLLVYREKEMEEASNFLRAQAETHDYIAKQKEEIEALESLISKQACSVV